MGVNINRSFKHYGWCTLIRGVESGGAVENLPCHTFPTDDGGVDMKCPTEIAISDRREAELAKNGFIPLIHRKNSDYAAFIGAQNRRSITIRTLRPTPISQLVCHIFSPVHGLRTSSNVSCATRSARSKSVKICSAGSMSGL